MYPTPLAASGARISKEVGLRPRAQGEKSRTKRLAAFGQPIDRGDWGTVQYLPVDQPHLLELGQPGGQHAFGDPGDRPSDLGEAGRPLQQYADDHTGPALPEECEHAGESLVAVDRSFLDRFAHGTILPPLLYYWVELRYSEFLGTQVPDKKENWR